MRRPGEVFLFEFADGWEWQHEELTSYMHERFSIRLKARQLGVSWLGIGYCAWKCLTAPARGRWRSPRARRSPRSSSTAPGTCGRTRPEHLRFDAEVIKPYKGRPSTRIEWEFPDGRISSLLAMPSSPRAGHGETAGVVFLDEFARHPYAAESWKAFIPVIADGGQILIVSTANGFGNTYYDLWTNADDRGIATRFLGADRHPGRDDAWFARDAEEALRGRHGRAVPAEPGRGVPGDGGLALRHRRAHPLRGEEPRPGVPGRVRRLSETGRRRPSAKRSDGMIRVWDEPEKGKEYAIYIDAATGRGKDYSSLTVIDLQTMNIPCELHGKLDPDLLAEQAHFLGRWYNTARIAVEMGGGYGRAGHHRASRRQAGAQAVPEAVPPRPGRPPRLQAEHHLRVPDHDQDAAADHQRARSCDPRGSPPAHPDGDDPGVQDLRPPRHAAVPASGRGMQRRPRDVARGGGGDVPPLRAPSAGRANIPQAQEA